MQIHGIKIKSSSVLLKREVNNRKSSTILRVKSRPLTLSKRKEEVQNTRDAPAAAATVVKMTMSNLLRMKLARLLHLAEHYLHQRHHKSLTAK